MHYNNHTEIQYEDFPVITELAWTKCDKVVTPPFHFDYLPTQVPKSPHCLQDSESAEKNTCTFCRGLGSHRPVCFKEAKKLKFSVWVCFKLELLEHQKSF